MNNFTGQVVLVTGGTGSVAKAVVKKLLASRNYAVGKIRIFSRDEGKQHDMMSSAEFSNGKTAIEYVIGDVRDQQSIGEAVKDVDIILHCAAMKHVPVCEESVREAYLTNIVGAMNVAHAALQNERVKAVVACSTDKACSPTTVMGASKLLQERIILNSAASGRFIRFMCVRFGNLLESRGSVFHVFFKQKKTGTITLTNAKMTRFVSTLDDAAESLMYAVNAGHSGDVIVRKCAAIKVELMAKAIAPDAKIVHYGARKNERIHELLYNSVESMHVKELDGHFIINVNTPQADRHETYSSEHHCLSDEATVELVHGFAARCGYAI